LDHQPVLAPDGIFQSEERRTLFFMFDLQRITTEYIPAEDRIRIVGKLADSSTITLWITRRLIILLLPYLIEWLQKRMTHSALRNRVGADLSTASHGSALSEVMQGFAQQAAILAMGELDPTPVRAREQGKEHLVRTADIISNDLGVRVVFKFGHADEGDRRYFMTMEQEPLRQWLYILHNQTELAGWSISSWPEWITAKERDESHLASSRH